MTLDKADIATAKEMAKTLQQSKNDELIVVGNLLAFLLKEREALANHIVDANKMGTQQSAERVNPQGVSNEQVEPVAKVNFYTGKIEWLMPVSFDIPVTIDVPPMYLYTHPPVPYVTPSRTAQPEEQEQRSVSEHLEPVAWAIGSHIESDYVFAKKTPLYTTPPQRTWAGLTDDERKTIAEANNALVDDDLFDEIEAKLKEKNI